MRLVEVVRGRATSESGVSTALQLTKRLSKVGVVVRNGPGFVGNRMMFPYMYEAQFLAEEGASPEQVDRVLTDWGMAMGIFAVDDMGGLDVAWRIRKELRQFEEPGARKPVVADILVEQGRLGQKTGRGWYSVRRRSQADPGPGSARRSSSRSRARPRHRAAFHSEEEILERTLYALVNEGARVLEAGIARRAADIDVIYLTGYGFPGFRGGPMFFADSVGLPKVHERVAAFHREPGPRLSRRRSSRGWRGKAPVSGSTTPSRARRPTRPRCAATRRRGAAAGPAREHRGRGHGRAPRRRRRRLSAVAARAGRIPVAVHGAARALGGSSARSPVPRAAAPSGEWRTLATPRRRGRPSVWRRPWSSGGSRASVPS